MQSRSTTDTWTQTNTPHTALSYNTEPPGPAPTVFEEQAQAAISPTTGDASKLYKINNAKTVN